MRDRLNLAATIVMVLAAVTMVGLAAYAQLFSGKGPKQNTVKISDWEKLARAGHVLGNPAAPVKIVEFADFQCPFCAAAQPILRSIREEFGDKVAVVFRHFPLQRIHRYAFAAAVAAECAAAQGRFSAYHDILYASQDSIQPSNFREFAIEAGVPNISIFKHCIMNRDGAEAVRRDLQAGRALGITGTPTFIINGVMVAGVPSRGRFEALVRSALQTSNPGFLASWF